jgi:hypothetical protein
MSLYPHRKTFHHFCCKSFFLLLFCFFFSAYAFIHTNRKILYRQLFAADIHSVAAQCKSSAKRTERVNAGIRFAFEEERLAQGLPITGKAFFDALNEKLKEGDG